MLTLILLCEEEHFMGMGWKEANYSLEISRRKCKCGAGYTVTYEHICEESDYPPFTKSDYQYTVCECKNKCEA